jgi:hypothetical protein
MAPSLARRSAVAKAQADLRGLYSALATFGAHCGDVPNAAITVTDVAPLTFEAGASTCAVAVGGGLAALGHQVSDTNNVPIGPFYTSGWRLTAPKCWSYTYTRTGKGQFTAFGTNPRDAANPITYP